MRYLLLSMVSLSLLTACQKPGGSTPAPDGKALAERFIKPAGDQAVVGVVFNARGEPIVAVGADGKLAEPCRLPQPKGEYRRDADAADSPLPECHGTTNTSIYNLSQVSALRHEGSNCMIFSMVSDGKARMYTICW